jgi:integrase/recombinase XerD
VDIFYAYIFAVYIILYAMKLATTSTNGQLKQVQPSSQQIIDAFIADLDVKPASKALYERTLKVYLDWMQSKRYTHADMNREKVLQYKSEQIARGCSPLTVASYLTVVRKLYGWAESNGWLSFNPSKDIKTPPKDQVFQKEVLTDAETDQLRNYFKSKSLRDYAIAFLVQRTGMRTIEVTRANIEDLTIREGERVLLVQGKGRDRKGEAVYISADVYSAIMEYLETRPATKGKEPLFTSCSDKNRGQRLTTRFISGLLKEGLRAIGLDDRRYSAHSLRHTVGTKIYELTGDIHQVQLALRHRSPVTSQIYARKKIEQSAIRKSPLKLLGA